MTQPRDMMEIIQSTVDPEIAKAARAATEAEVARLVREPDSATDAPAKPAETPAESVPEDKPRPSSAGSTAVASPPAEPYAWATPWGFSLVRPAWAPVPGRSAERHVWTFGPRFVAITWAGPGRYADRWPGACQEWVQNEAGVWLEDARDALALPVTLAEAA